MTEQAHVGAPVLEAENLSIQFGGLKALQELSFSIPEKTVFSIIGPNGAGKTTFFNIVTGIYRPTGGDVRLYGESIVGLEPSRIVERGVCRTFQNIRLFQNLTVLENVMIGEVWVCSGQSNMQMSMTGNLGEPVDGGVEALIEAPKYKDIRLFYTPMVTSPQPVDTCGGEWKVSSSESVAPFSAAAYFFARDLNDALGVPVGLIQTAWGGTRIEAWMPEATAREVEADIVQTNDRFENPNKVGYLYNAMIRPLLNMTARGFIWYQGESNVHTNNYPHYAHYMEKLVSQWRGDWGDPDMPFYFVQLVPHIYEGGTDGIVLPLMIEQQLAAADRIPNCAMIGTSDMANAGTIHPSEKDQIGRRLALLALTKTYGLKGLIAESPRFESVRFEGGKAILQFKTEGTLGPNYKGRIKGFEIAGADKVFIPARAEYVWGQPYTVVVSSELVSEPVAVRYAFRNVPAAATLTNTGGLPAFPFRTDDWDDVK